MPDQSTDAFLRERKSLIALACTIVNNEAVAEDLIQDSWLRWSGKTYPSDKARPILRRIVANLAKDWQKKQRNERHALSAHLLTLDNAPDTERVVIAKQDLERVVVALGELPPKMLKAFSLHRVEGLTYVQIGKEIGTVPSRAFTLVEEAMVHLAMRLSE
ncbi:MAG: RNA polymerase sigma factor [Pseudomonadota bacterium]